MESAKSQHVFFVKSTDSLGIFPNNTASDFTIELPELLYLKGKWECSLYEISFTENLVKDIIVCSDIVENSIIANSKHQVLRVIAQPSTAIRHVSFSQLLWLPVSRDQIKRFRIFIKDNTTLESTFISGTVKCTVVVRKASN